MASTIPLVLQLPRRALVRRDAIRRLVSAFDFASFTRAEVEAAFAFKDEELPFACMLTTRRSQLWLFRANQRAFAGDFFVVDVSSSRVAKRPVIALDLKRGQRVRLGRAGIQMQRTADAIASLAASGVVSRDAQPLHATGDANALLVSLAAILQTARHPVSLSP